jgi:carboxypeptidase C (cathepsin A)
MEDGVMKHAIARTGAFHRQFRLFGAILLKIVSLAAGPASVAFAATSAHPVAVRADQLAPMLTDDETVVVSEHRIETKGPLVYEVRVGRIPIRNEDTGQLRGRIFFVAYVVKTSGPRRPITFAWNGGPLVASAIVHMEGLGPRRRTATGMVDNPDTLLVDTDLVFMDAMETGFSRPVAPEFAPEFMNMQGDVNTTAEFIRAYRARFRAVDQPLFIAGESYGVFRASALVDRLTAAHEDVAGTILISGDIPNIPQPPGFYDAMHVPARTATAFYYKRLSPDLMRDRDATMKAALDWARTVYMPALERVSQLTPDEREKIATDLAHYIGIDPAQVNRDTLVVHAQQYLSTFLSLDGSKQLTGEDTRVRVGGEGDDLGDGKLVDRYIRGELGYTTDLVYAGLENGYMPVPGPKKMTIRDQWVYNQPGITPAVIAESRESGEVSPLARANPPWIVDALKQEKDMRLFVATGRYDPLNMCEGDAIVVSQLPSDLANRVSTHCYESGHIIFRDPKARVLFLHDVSAFIQQTMASRRVQH